LQRRQGAVHVIEQFHLVPARVEHAFGVAQTQTASVSMLQRRLGLGYTRAARIIDMMEEDGVVGPYQGSKPRDILIASLEEYEKAK